MPCRRHRMAVRQIRSYSCRRAAPCIDCDAAALGRHASLSQPDRTTTFRLRWQRCASCGRWLASGFRTFARPTEGWVTGFGCLGDGGIERASRPTFRCSPPRDVPGAEPRALLPEASLRQDGLCGGAVARGQRLDRGLEAGAQGAGERSGAILRRRPTRSSRRPGRRCRESCAAWGIPQRSTPEGHGGAGRRA
jgi:hypothetical protein